MPSTVSACLPTQHTPCGELACSAANTAQPNKVQHSTAVQACHGPRLQPGTLAMTNNAVVWCPTGNRPLVWQISWHLGGRQGMEAGLCLDVSKARARVHGAVRGPARGVAPPHRVQCAVHSMKSTLQYSGTPKKKGIPKGKGHHTRCWCSRVHGRPGSIRGHSSARWRAEGDENSKGKGPVRIGTLQCIPPVAPSMHVRPACTVHAQVPRYCSTVPLWH